MPELALLLKTGQVTGRDCVHRVAALVEGLARALRGPHCLVLDDGHRLEGFPSGLAVLKRLVRAAPPNLRLVVASRNPVTALLGEDLPAREVLRLGNQDLAMSRTETAALFNGVLGIPLAPETLRAIEDATEGWPMGLRLIGQALAGGASPEVALALPGPVSGGSGHLTPYFRRELMAAIPRGLGQDLLRLSLLEEIPAPLARDVAENPHIVEGLEHLARKHLFVRRLDGGQSGVVLHHLFRQWLADEAATVLPREEANRILARAAAYYEAAGQSDTAADYRIAAGDIDAAEAVLRIAAPAMAASNRVVRLGTILGRIPAEEIVRRPWLAYYQGLVEMDRAPQAAVPYLEGARQRFVLQEKPLGELLASVQLINFHCLAGGRFHEVATLTRRAEILYGQTASRLDPYQRLLANFHLGDGHSLGRWEPDKSARHYGRALDEADRLHLDSQVVAILTRRCYLHAFSGHFHKTLADIERANRLLAKPHLTQLSRLTQYWAQLNMLFMCGDMPGYFFFKNHLEELAKGDMLAQSFLGSFRMRFAMEEALHQEAYDEALALGATALEQARATNQVHLCSYFLQFMAFAHASIGETEPARQAGQECLALRERAGGVVYTRMARLIVGAAYARCGLVAEATDLFAQVVADPSDGANPFVQANVHAFLAQAWLERGQHDKAAQDAGLALTALRRCAPLLMHCWSPGLLKTLVELATPLKKELSFARRLAWERLGMALAKDGSLAPLLDVRTLGGLELATREGNVLRGEELPPNVRRLLGLLLAAPRCSLDQELIQLALWPDASPENGRASFDTLLARLRRALAGALGPQAAKRHVVLRNSVLRLQHCRVDAQDFIRLYDQAQVHLGLQEYWQAGNVMRPALRLWGGDFLPGFLVDEAVWRQRQILSERYRKTVATYAGLCERYGPEPEAWRVLAKGTTFAPLTEELVGQFYALASRSGNAVEADRIMRHYAAALRREGYDAHAVDGMLERLWKR